MERFQVTPQLLRVGIASMTQLPPSASPRSRPEPLALNESKSTDEEEEKEEISPLNAVARYTDFQPEALACSMPLAASYNSDDNGQRRQGRELPFTSLGAVAGPHGVALFRVSKPHIPLLFLKHESQMNSAGVGSGTSLAFQPENGHSLYLASARGSGILVWDVSGNSLSPLAGRLGFDPAVAGSNIANTRITSMAWQPNHPNILAATTPTVACLWDLRSSSSSSSVKPILTFVKSQRMLGNTSGPSLVYVACTNHNSCATMDAKGFVHLFDLRLTGSNNNTIVGAVSSFSSFNYAGVGVAAFPTSKDSHGLITWGLDEPDRAVVKVWSPDVSAVATIDNDDYWYMDSSMEPSLRTCAHLKKSGVGGFRLVAQCTSPGLACARVCPAPIEDHFVTISASSVTAEGDGWKAEVWKMGEKDPFGLDKVVSLRGGSIRDMSLRQLLGKSSLGQICGAELALLSSSVQPRRPSESSRLDGDDEMRLVLCCLTGNGFVTSQLVPEVSPKKSDAIGHSSGLESPVRLSRLGVRGLLAGNTTKVINLDRDGYALHDAASAWNAQGDHMDGRVRIFNDDDAADNPPSSPSIHVDSHLDYEGFQSLARQPDAGTTPFDMDNAMTFGSTVALGAVGDASQAGLSTIVDEGIPATSEIRAASDWMELIDKSRIPCPRLCGATFGCGVGGIAIFNNGDVKKMWSWYEQSHAQQKTSLAFESFEVQLPVSGFGPSKTITPYHFNAGDDSRPKEFPRSFQDLTDMIGTAKEAQWGEVVDSSRSCEDEGDDYFEEESLDDGSNSSDSIEDELTRKKGGEVDMQDSKSDEGRPPLLRKLPDSPSSPGRKIRGPGAGGPSSDMLAPFVRVKLEFDGLLLNNQSPELAISMKLGDWDPPRQDRPTIGDSGLKHHDSPEWVVNSAQSGRNVLIPGQELPHYRTLFPGDNTKPLAKVKSDPILNMIPEYLGLPFKEDEPGVHGGEYSVRPGRQESMVFLRKLFTHQQEGGMVYPSLISPPDGPMLPSSLSPLKRNRSLASISFPFNNSETDDRERLINRAQNTPLGVYTLDGQESNSRRKSRISKLIKTRDLCAHNVAACETAGQDDKANVWSLLAETLDGLVENTSDDFSGWGGVAGGSLGRGLVQNLLRYYESLGDVQMLSTLVCVLSGGSRKSQPKIDDENLLLPVDCNELYDAYLRKYSEILYAWGLLNTRAEINKHLSRIPSTGDGQLTFDSVESLGGGRLPGLAIAMTCPRCGLETKDGTNVCQSCRDFILRCSICSDAVRGLFTMCEICGHGGHVGHLMNWFAISSDCPTGCGCKCTALKTRSDSLSEHLMGPPNLNSTPSFDPMVDVSAEGLSHMREVHFARIVI